MSGLKPGDSMDFERTNVVFEILMETEMLILARIKEDPQHWGFSAATVQKLQTDFDAAWALERQLFIEKYANCGTADVEQQLPDNSWRALMRQIAEVVKRQQNDRPNLDLSARIEKKVVERRKKSRIS